MAVKGILRNVTNRLCRYPVCQKFRRNRSVSDLNRFLCLTQKFKIAFKSGRKTIFWKIASRLCRYPSGQKFRQNRSISLCFQDKQVFVFNTEIQDGRQKWQENDFWEKSAVDSVATLWVKNTVEIALSRSISEISGFLRLTQKFKMATKSGRKTIFYQKVASRHHRYPVDQKFCRNRSISLRF